MILSVPCLPYWPGYLFGRDHVVRGLSQIAHRELTLAEGDVLFRFDDKIRSLFVVASRGVRLVRYLPRGPTLTLQLAEKTARDLAEASLFATNTVTMP